MELTLIKLSLERLHENVEELKEENKQLKSRLDKMERQKLEPSVEFQKQTVSLEGELLDTKQVRKILGISHNTLQAIVKKGRLTQRRINGRNVRYLKSEIHSYITSLGEI